MAGFIVGIVDRERILDGGVDPDRRRADRLCPPPACTPTASPWPARSSSRWPASVQGDPVDGLDGTAAEVLLAEHRCYLNVLDRPIRERLVAGLAHITGGGLTDNIPRVLPEGTAAEIDTATWTVPPLFRFLQETGNVEPGEMFRTFNMGVGMVVIVPGGEYRQDRELVAGGRGGLLPDRIDRGG